MKFWQSRARYGCKISSCATRRLLVYTVCIRVDSAFATKTNTSASRQNLSIHVSRSGETSIPGLLSKTYKSSTPHSICCPSNLPTIETSVMLDSATKTENYPDIIRRKSSSHWNMQFLKCQHWTGIVQLASSVQHNASCYFSIISVLLAY